MSEPESIVIAGAGLAGAKAAETLRTEGFGGRVTLLGSELLRPYERPPLSKGLLLGTAAPDEPFVHEAGWYAEHGVDLRLGAVVTGIDRAARVVRTASGEDVGYDRLLLATGAMPRRLDGSGTFAHTLRTWTDADHFAAVLKEKARLVIVGAGWIGMEVAAAARQRGAQVTVVTPDRLPLRAVLGDTVAEVFAELHRAHGVEFRFGAHTTEIRPDGVTLDDGTTLQADAVLVAIGAVPNAELAAEAGLATGDGVHVDALHTTSDPAIFAAGDLAAVDHPLLGARIRVEHWANALDSGPAAARAMLGRGTPWDKLPFFFTDQYDLGMEYAGWVPPGTQPRVVVRGDLAGREAIVFWLAGDRVAAGMNLNVWDVQDQIQDLIRAGLAGRKVDLDRLADESVPLPDLLP
ncbi:NAD(P)/FAD-dependent oxidoreductase [Catenuloplanes atrovinosus]|uniref:NADPH-dependent 2,4-dienoyl-CoA reductase/sulfur reductase-like enzyme n=1 Tax=Catenuloplanes atrovinosus TaxID=137266 RepID=A0AAE3YMT0_9ACTN|nr:FAD-dependent oxidoreductase [Catenuloplanes atrovinosus]MDR7275064.1 NADPH-dependent 2,4-dienoyl-CoA reductase/sulfur reductase-like enzyme [Catenuloplanes atrovinosus]